MKTVLLLSAGRHPVSGTAVIPRLEAQMLQLAAACEDRVGVHAGDDVEKVREALGLGLGELDYVRTAAGADPVPALIAYLQSAAPDLVLCGRRGQGGDESGMVPYLLADALSYSLIPDVIHIARGPEPGTLTVEQALPKGARRHLDVKLPFVATVHPAAPAPRAFAYGQMRNGRVREIPPSEGSDAPVAPTVEERVFKPRPKLMRTAPSGASAAERLLAATGASEGAGAEVMLDPTPELAARAILDYLRRVGVGPLLPRQE